MRLLALLSLAAAPPALADDAFLYLTIDGEEVDGPSTTSGVDGSIPLTNLDFSSVRRADTYTMVVGKSIDATSPLLHDAVRSSNPRVDAEIVVRSPQEDGSNPIVYTLAFTDGAMGAVDTVLATRASGRVFEQLTLSFTEYTITWNAP